MSPSELNASEEVAMNCILDQLDIIQCSPEEKEAQEMFRAYRVKHTGEWDHESINHGIIIGDIDQGDRLYFNLLDELEMNDDIHLWEMVEACHEHFANGGSVDVCLPINITKMGDKYSTAECDFGKVFVPNVALNFFQRDIQMCYLQFKGYEDARINHTNGRKMVSMPWRCIKVQ